MAINTNLEKKTGLAGIRQNPLNWFLLQAGIMYLLWLLLGEYFLESESGINAFLTKNIAQVSAMVLTWFGFNAYATEQISGSQNYDFVYLNDKPAVYIESGCNGLVLMAFFVIFIIAYPGKLNRKLWYIPMGIAVIYIMNIIRVALLAINIQEHRSSFDFNHKYVFTTLVYIVIFIMWMIWANKVSGVKFSELGPDEANNTPQK